MHKQLLTFSVVVALVLASAPSAQADIDVQGHRGARSVLPENTLAGFAYALEIGVDTLELDLGVTKDHVVVIVHDQIINPDICQYRDGRKIDEPPLVHSLTLAQLKEFDCGSKANPRFSLQSPRPGSRIPTLAELFAMVANSEHPNAKKVRFNIETKSNPARPNAQPSPEKFVQLVIAQIDKYNLRERANLQSFDPRTLTAAQQQAPDIPRAILLREAPSDWLAVAKKYQVQIVSPYFEEIEQEDVTLMQKAGLQVIPWTPNAEHQWRALLKLGVDGIITDDPLPLLKILDRQ